MNEPYICPVCKDPDGNVDYTIDDGDGVIIENYTCQNNECNSTWKVKIKLIDVYDVVNNKDMVDWSEPTSDDVDVWDVSIGWNT